MHFWTTEIRGEIRAFLSAANARAYAIDKLTIEGVPPEHHEFAGDVHVLISPDTIARVQPLALQYSGNPNGHGIVIS